MIGVFVSVTGFKPASRIKLVPFWWHTLRCLAQARRAPGNVSVSARVANDYYHTVTVWTDENSMRAYIRDGAHRRAMVNHRSLGTGRVHHFYHGRPPSWGEAYTEWLRCAREV